MYYSADDRTKRFWGRRMWYWCTFRYLPYKSKNNELEITHKKHTKIDIERASTIGAHAWISIWFIYRRALCSQKCINDAGDGGQFWWTTSATCAIKMLQCYYLFAIYCIAWHRLRTKDNAIWTMPTNPKQTNKQIKMELEMNKFTIKLIIRNFGQFFNECIIILCAIQIIHVRLIS